ncbi:MAG: hypothetical protein WD009_11740, partial [Phycisphaeraceae bacterium]
MILLRPVPCRSRADTIKGRWRHPPLATPANPATPATTRRRVLRGSMPHRRLPVMIAAALLALLGVAGLLRG